MIFQQFNLLMQRTCLRQNVMLPAGAGRRPRDKAEARSRAEELLELVGLANR